MGRRTKAAIDRTPEVEAAPAVSSKLVRAASRQGWQLWGAQEHPEMGWVRVALHPKREYRVLREGVTGILGGESRSDMWEVECTATGIRFLTAPGDVESV